MKTVQIKSGDTLAKIAKAHNTTVDALVKANNIQNPNRIVAGQTLRIPDSFGTTPSASTAWNSYTQGASTGGPVTASNGRNFPTSADGTPLFKQGDAQWGSRTLGVSKTLSSHGCAVTASAMAMSKISGQVIDPGQLDAYLDANKGYDGNNLYWGKAANMAGLSATSGGMNFNTLNQQLDAGRPVVLAVDHTGDGKTDHYITLTGRNGNTYYANDPATGASMTMSLQNGKLVGNSANKKYTSTNQMVTFSGGKANLPTAASANASTASASAQPPKTGTTATTAVNATQGTPAAGGVSVEQLRAIMPNLSKEKAEAYLPHLNAAMAEANINTPQRQAAFLAQLAHESGEFRWMEELASGAAYEGRKDLGNTQPGDGVRFKGRGPIQLTGRANYEAAGKALGIDLVNNPKRAADPDVGFRTAAWFWTQKGLNNFADKGDFLTITKRINGGTNGLADRQKYYNRALQTLGA